MGREELEERVELVSGSASDAELAAVADEKVARRAMLAISPLASNCWQRLSFWFSSTNLFAVPELHSMSGLYMFIAVWTSTEPLAARIGRTFAIATAASRSAASTIV
ncbi:MAG TPA: hypothetical protein DEG43_02440 [Acidimicrobiaceae bacterium]|jgi:hypothetical protein|nr:hypothetical protein [Acidimicrobiaceae bacterium]